MHDPGLAALHSGDVKLDNPDQRVTADIASFSAAFADFLPTLFKPLLDICVFTRMLGLVLGPCALFPPTVPLLALSLTRTVNGGQPGWNSAVSV